ncbi:hypothetical protein Slin15195_G059800 [Septoria linicola]|uniref:Uncharacterized protein n=1 Tax=Septoria linicola TaxID=215465 RepID=A0A9Q9AXX9_9PEZI|nr:hypothetical protein Slin14017_G075660 [Septoria linicola]USW52661.1 hypothetical protein Slin15195_G059800 [Septoria linicola]
MENDTIHINRVRALIHKQFVPMYTFESGRTDYSIPDASPSESLQLFHIFHSVFEEIAMVPAATLRWQLHAAVSDPSATKLGRSFADSSHANQQSDTTSENTLECLTSREKSNCVKPPSSDDLKTRNQALERSHKSLCRVKESLNRSTATALQNLFPFSAIPYYAKLTFPAIHRPSTLDKLSAGFHSIKLQLERKRKFASLRASIAASEGSAEAALKKRKKAASLFKVVRKAIPHDKQWEGIAPLRRPEFTTEWYSNITTPAEWAKHTNKKRQALSHIGYIHETDAGQMHSTGSCYWGMSGSYPFEELGKTSKSSECWSYKESAAGVYSAAFSNKAEAEKLLEAT